jgi:hypothetical protein
MSIKTLFGFRFTADLDGYHVRLLREATGMRIGDTDDLSKDTPGKGQIALGVNIHLWRPSNEPNDWQIEATTREDDYDFAAVTACRDRLLQLLPQIAQRWEETNPAAE